MEVEKCYYLPLSARSSQWSLSAPGLARMCWFILVFVCKKKKKKKLEGEINNAANVRMEV